MQIDRIIIFNNLKKKMNNPTAKLELITVDIAKDLLTKNKINRPMNEVNLNGIMSDMKRDNYHLTGESIKISKTGNLIDGQHRLMAITKIGKPIQMFVIRGLSDDAFKYIDTGRTRKASDVLGIEGIPNPARVASMVRFIINFKNGQYSNASQNIKRGKSFITNSDVSKFVSDNKQSIFDSLPFGFCKENKVISGNILASLHYIFKGKNSTDADTFCWGVASGENISKESPIYLLRNKLMADIRATRKMGKLERIALVCKAWNLFRGGKSVSILKWDSIKEPFPKPL
jgi:hypothetical protein